MILLHTNRSIYNSNLHLCKCTLLPALLNNVLVVLTFSINDYQFACIYIIPAILTTFVYIIPAIPTTFVYIIPAILTTFVYIIPAILTTFVYIIPAIPTTFVYTLVFVSATYSHVSIALFLFAHTSLWLLNISEWNRI